MLISRALNHLTIKEDIMYRIARRSAFIEWQMKEYGGIDLNIDVTDGLWALFIYFYDWCVFVLFPTIYSNKSST